MLSPPPKSAGRINQRSAATMPSQNEIDRRYKNIRAAMEAEKVDALIVCGNQYAGFEGAVRYTSGFEIVHRYVYVLIPLSGDPVLVFPREARWIGDKKAPFVREKVWAEIPGKWLRDEIEKHHWKRVAVYGMDFIMAVRDFRELQGQSFELVPFDFHSTWPPPVKVAKNSMVFVTAWTFFFTVSTHF